jgi:ElaB/YqjD/DUF883 family membrane-anchored ribosome-binding protein
MSGTDEILNELQSLKAKVMRLAGEKVDDFRASSQTQAEALTNQIKRNLADLENALKGREQDLEQTVAKHPMPALAAAVGIGLLLGLTMRRIA